MKTDVIVNASSLLSNMKINVRVSGVRVASIRLWIAAALIRCAALVLGCDVVTDREGQQR